MLYNGSLEMAAKTYQDGQGALRYLMGRHVVQLDQKDSKVSVVFSDGSAGSTISLSARMVRAPSLDAYSSEQRRRTAPQ